VGEEVHAHFEDHDARVGERNLDLAAVARAQLEAAGVEEVLDVELCTICADPSLFFSHRRDAGVTGRQAGVVWRA
jgi:copper oxidase (laccase) domain-containing protein